MTLLVINNAGAAVFATLGRVFSRWTYTTTALLVSVCIFFVLTMLHNIQLLADVVVSPLFSIGEKASLLIGIVQSVPMNVPLYALLISFLTSVLIGVNLSLLLYMLVRQRNVLGKKGAVAAGGVAGGIVSTGCASCGSSLLLAVLAFFGISGVLLYLPLRGEEVGIFSAAILLLSIGWNALAIEKSRAGAVCKISPLS